LAWRPDLQITCLFDVVPDFDEGKKELETEGLSSGFHIKTD